MPIIKAQTEDEDDGVTIVFEVSHGGSVGVATGGLVVGTDAGPVDSGGGFAGATDVGPPQPLPHSVEVFRPGHYDGTGDGSNNFTFTASVDGQVGDVSVFIEGDVFSIEADEAVCAERLARGLLSGKIVLEGVS
jgi:hypothetical protein